MRPLFLFLTVLLSGTGFSQNPFLEEDSKLFYESVSKKADSLFNDFGFAAPGSAVVIIHNGNIIHNKGYGLASLEHGLSITSQTVFDLASISKMFTGYAIASLLVENKISLADDIRKYIPEFPDYGHKITIGHLAYHTSGIKNWTEFIPIAGWSFDDVINTRQILSLTFRQKELEFIPGSKYEYCNTGYVLLAEVVQRVTGMSLQNWSKQNIFSPLQMTNTTILDDHTAVVPSKAQSYYTGTDGQFHLSPTSCSVPGSSSVHSSANDLAKWLLFLDEPGEKKSIINLMYQPGTLNNGQKVDYGLGVVLKTFKGTAVRRHEGFWPSYSTYLFTIPEKHLSIAVLNNSPQQSYREVLELVSMFITNEYEDDKKPGTKLPNREIAMEPSFLQSLTGIYRGGPGWYLTVSLNGSGLMVKTTSDDVDYPMLALSDSMFYVDEFKEQMTFTRNKDEELGLNFKNKIHPKIKVHNVTPQQQKDLPGKYCSDELQTCYQVSADNGKLILQHPHLGQFALTHGLNLDFTINGADRWFPAAMEFKADANLQVNSLKIGKYHFTKEE